MNEINIEINNKQSKEIKKNLVKKIAELIIKKNFFSFLANKKISISFAVVDEEEMKKINKAYRKINKPTDVLSFSEYKSKEAINKEKAKEVFLGEIILCYNDIRKYSQKEKKDLSEELTKVIAHGILHLLGMKHGERMFKIQDEITRELRADLNE